MSKKLKPFLAHSELTDCIYIIDGNDKYEVTEQCINAMKATNRLSRWIPVSERLPDKSEYGEMLVTFIPSAGTLWTTVMIAHYSDLMGISKPCFHIGEVGKSDFRDITKQVVAWMPLPTPYKAERIDKE